MEPSTTNAIIAGLVGLITGAIGSLIAPWVQWGVEKRRKKLERRTALIQQDIYGRDDINNLLGLFPTVERQHFKLWLSSTTVLEDVLHSRIINQTRITLQEIADKARLSTP